MAFLLHRARLLQPGILTSCGDALLSAPCLVDTATAAAQRRGFAAGPAPPPPAEEPQQPAPPGSGPEPDAEPKQLHGMESHPLLKAHLEQLQHLRGRSHVLEQSMADPLPPWQRWAATVFGSWMQGWIADFLRMRVEKDFDAHEWLEGAKDAFWGVHQLLGEEDYEGLRPMVSSKLLEALQATGKEYSAGGLTWRTEIDADAPLEAQLRGISVWGRREVAKYHPEAVAAAGEEEEGGGGGSGGGVAWPGGQWLVLTVQLQAAQRTTITRQENGAVVAKLEDRRPTQWRFATGPLPRELPLQQLDTPWWLVTIG